MPKVISKSRTRLRAVFFCRTRHDETTEYQVQSSRTNSDKLLENISMVQIEHMLNIEMLGLSRRSGVGSDLVNVTG